MEKRLCYCKSCEKFFLIDPGSPCPKCKGGLRSSVVTEEEWNKSGQEQRSIFKNSLAGMTNRSSSSAGTGASQNTQSGGKKTQKDKPYDHEKTVKNFKNWSVAIGILGVVGFFSLYGQMAQLQAQGYRITNMSVFYLGFALSVFTAFAGFYGAGILKHPERLNNSVLFYIAALVGMAALAVFAQVFAGWLIAAGCVVNVINGNKIKKHGGV